MIDKKLFDKCSNRTLVELKDDKAPGRVHRQLGSNRTLVELKELIGDIALKVE